MSARGVGMAARTAASLAIAFFGIRRASEVAKLSVGDVQVGTEEGVVDLKVNRQKNDPFGLGQLPYLLAAKSWQEACPVRLPSG